uniref:hypothetical protein n=1 Tax=Flavobacterium sp. TaxID=239 RepID=UPI00404A4008
MAIPSIEIINALRKTADQIERGSSFEWGHMGRCNCGNLAQTITNFTQEEIHKFAMEKRGGWSDQLIDYCPTSGYPMDLIIQKMITLGFTKDDLTNLEWLSDVNIVDRIDAKRTLHRNNRHDAVAYMKTWANMLEEELLDEMKLEININEMFLETV